MGLGGKGWIGNIDIIRVGQNHIYTVYGVHMVYLAWKSPNIRCIYIYIYTVLANPRYNGKKYCLLNGDKTENYVCSQALTCGERDGDTSST
jgi:hypothetical protein